MIDTSDLHHADAFKVMLDFSTPLKRLGSVRFEYESRDPIVISVRCGYRTEVELGRGCTVRQALEDMMKNAKEHQIEREN
jgi:hypothetical protein